MTEQRFNAYYLALAEESEPLEWAEFTRVAQKRNGWKFIPSVSDLLEALRVFRGGPANAELQQEAARAYERVLSEGGTYTAEAGTSWNYRTVMDRCGKAAADAFLEAGGHHAFATTYHETERRERFLAAFVHQAREQPATMLPDGEQVKQIEGDTAEARISLEDARAVLRKLTGAVKVDGPQPKRLTEQERQERLERLRQQAQALEPVEQR